MIFNVCVRRQVLVPTYSRAGRVKIPSCIACDRPLLEKVNELFNSFIVMYINK